MAVTMDTVLDFRRPQFSSRKSKLSSASKSFFMLNIIQVISIGGIQTSMMIIGDYSSVSNEGMGPGRRVYMALFTGAVIYSCFLCLFAVKTENFLEIIAFVLQNFGYIAYSFIQVYHINYKTYHHIKIHTPASLTILSILNPVLLVVMNAVFIYLAFKLFVEYGWKIYKRVRFNIKLRAAYHLYELVICLMKMAVLFVVMFSVCVVCTILRDRPSHPYYAVTFAKIPFAVTVCVVAVIGIHRENKLLMAVIIILLLIIEAGFVYDLYSIISRTCIGCKEILESTVDIPQELLLHLIYLASVSILFVFLLLLSTVKVTMNFGMGLKHHFAGLSKNSTVLFFGLSRDVVSTFFNSSLNKSGVFDHVPDVLENDSVVVNDTVTTHDSIVLNDTVTTHGSPEKNGRNDTQYDDIEQFSDIDAKSFGPKSYFDYTPDVMCDEQRAERKSSTIPARLPDQQRLSVVERLSQQASERLNRIYLQRRTSADTSVCGWCCFFQKRKTIKTDFDLYPGYERKSADGAVNIQKNQYLSKESVCGEGNNNGISTRRLEFRNKSYVCTSISEEPEPGGFVRENWNENLQYVPPGNLRTRMNSEETENDSFQSLEFWNHGFHGDVITNSSSARHHVTLGTNDKEISSEEV